ncbi:hypothetical protein CBD41_02695 [bacterium TMED181]|nr:hypothetical protein [Planctomycetota bacterium]OUW46295.1 MAG: hypothetical protein CBD41_02695 [bacterium TMED181]
MKSNSLMIMVLLILVSGALLFVNQEKEYTEIAGPPEALSKFAQINPEMLDAIELRKGDVSYQILRKGREWFLPNLWDSAADRDEVIRLLDDLQSISDAEKRGESSASHSTFEVDSEKGIRVTLKNLDMATFVDLVIGKNDGNGKSFVRLADSDQVFSVKPNLRRRPALSGAEFSADQWYHKVLYQLPENAVVRELILNRGDMRIVLEWVPGAPAKTATGESGELVQSGTDPEWWIREPENVQADTNTVKGLISALKNVRSELPLDPTDTEAAGFKEPSASLEVVLVDDTRVILEFGSEQDLPFGGQGIAARIKGDDRIAVTPKWVRDGLIKSLEDLKVVEPVTEDSPESVGNTESAISPAPIPASED